MYHDSIARGLLEWPNHVIIVLSAGITWRFFTTDRGFLKSMTLGLHDVPVNRFGKRPILQGLKEIKMDPTAGALDLRIWSRWMAIKSTIAKS